MDWRPDCSICFFNQMLALARKCSIKGDDLKNFLKDVGRLFSEVRLDESPPEFAIKAYSLIEKYTGIKDPYREEKKKSNELALETYTQVKAKIVACENPLLMALFIAIAGNIIDYGVRYDVDVLEEINAILDIETQEIGSVYFKEKEFLEKLTKAKSILYIADNCGEIVFDKIFIEEILAKFPDKNITVAVRSGPIINDATEIEAKEIGLDKICRVITTGIQAPGVILDMASEEFSEAYYKSDLVIAKGQGNFEAMSETGREVFFLFIAKCEVVADVINCPIGHILLINTNK